MMQTVEAVIDEKGRVHLLEAVETKRMRRAFVTLLPDSNNMDSANSLQNLGEVLDDDLENASDEISAEFRNAVKNSAENLGE